MYDYFPMGKIYKLNIRKIEAMTDMKSPTHQKQVRRFIGIVKYYRDMWPRRSHTLPALTKITPNKRKFKWTKIEQEAFDEIKRIVAYNSLLTYPGFYEFF